MQNNTDSATAVRISGDTLLRWMMTAMLAGLAVGVTAGIVMLFSR